MDGSLHDYQLDEARESRSTEANPFVGLELCAEHVQIALNYLWKSGPLVEDAEYEVEKAERDLKRIYAEIYRVTPGRTEKDRECTVLVHEKYEAAVERLARARACIAGHKQRVKTAETTITAWQSMRRTFNAVKI